MRAIIALALLCAPVVAHADSYVGLAGGLAFPMSDSQYTDTVDTSPVLGLRVGAIPKSLGGYLSFEWMPANLKNQVQGADISAHRFRLLVGPEVYHPISNTLTITGRAGIGLDIAHDSFSATIPIIGTVNSSETDVGLGFEFAGGVWFHVGGIEIGGELSLPVSIHDDDTTENDYDYNYTAVDLQLLAGVRFVSRSGSDD